jgi:CBS domain-containing protein
MLVDDVMQRNVATVSEDDSLGLARQVMLWRGIRHLPVLRAKDGRPVGVLSERDVLRALEADPAEQALAKPVRELMSMPAEHIHPRAPLGDAAADLNTKRIGCLLVVETGALVGILTPSDVIGPLATCSTDLDLPAELSETPVLEQPVAAIMHPEPIAVHPDDHLLDAAAMLAQNRVRHACVVDGEGRVLGILSDRDVRRAFGNPARAVDLSGSRADAVRVEHAMTGRPRMVNQDAPVAATLEALIDDRVGALPVTDDDGHLRGIVSYVDVLQHLATEAATALH